MHIGYVGLGAMGGALARRLLGQHRLTVWDLNGSAALPLQALGASVAPSARELARACDVVLLCLPRSADVRTLLFGPDGLAAGLGAGKMVIDQTSGVPGETRDIADQLAALGVAMIDAPVSGGTVGAAAGTITIMISGADGDCGRALPILTSISPNVFRVGHRVGDAQAMKLVNNLMSFGSRVATLEVVAMGRKLGLPLAAIADAINRGPARSRTSRSTLQGLADGTLVASTFTLSMMLKDLGQAIQLGMECGVPTTLTNIVRGIVQVGVNTLGDNAQLDDLVGLIEGMAGTHLVDPAHSTSGASEAAAPVATDAKPLRVGYVGLGAMGGALARRMMLTRKLMVFDARREVVQAFAAEGADVATDLPGLARECDVIFTCLPTSAVVQEVIFGKAGLAEGLSRGKVIVDQTTGDPTMTRLMATELARLGVALVDAPVTGGPRGAVAGTITIMAGGPAPAFARVKPVFESVSPNLVYFGPAGNGHVAKLVSNAVSTCHVLLVYEGASIAVKSGLRLADVAQVINSGGGWSAASERILPALSEGKATADFQMQLMVKDLKLVGRLAIECGAPILVARTVSSLYETGMHRLGGTANIDAMAKLFESMGGLTFAGS